MILLNNLLIMFALTLFASTTAIKNLDQKFTPIEAVETISFKEQFSRFAFNNESVLSAYDRFEKALRESDIAENEIETILNAALFAAVKHQNQTRKDLDRTPYIIHPIGVAHSILTIAKVSTPEILMGALLHDTVEDTETSFAEIEEKFGNEVMSYVREVTDDKSLPKQVRKELQIINASHKSEGAALIKLSDKLNNLTDLSKGLPFEWTQQRCDEYFLWAKKVVDQLPPASPELKKAVDDVIEGFKSKLPGQDRF